MPTNKNVHIQWEEEASKQTKLALNKTTAHLPQAKNTIVAHEKPNIHWLFLGQKIAFQLQNDSFANLVGAFQTQFRILDEHFEKRMFWIHKKRTVKFKGLHPRKDCHHYNGETTHKFSMESPKINRPFLDFFSTKNVWHFYDSIAWKMRQFITHCTNKKAVNKKFWLNWAKWIPEKWKWACALAKKQIHYNRRCMPAEKRNYGIMYVCTQFRAYLFLITNYNAHPSASFFGSKNIRRFYDNSMFQFNLLL